MHRQVFKYLNEVLYPGAQAIPAECLIENNLSTLNHFPTLSICVAGF